MRILGTTALGYTIRWIKCIFETSRYSYTFSNIKIFSMSARMFSSVQSLSGVWLFVTLWTSARQASLSITSSWSLPKLMSIESVMPSNHLILCGPLLLLPSIFPNIRVFSNESALHIRWPKYWSFSFNISPSSEHPGLISFRTFFLVEHKCWQNWQPYVYELLHEKHVCFNTQTQNRSCSLTFCNLFFP